jgi:putative nucleotidyltransferase with HDIG domain
MSVITQKHNQQNQEEVIDEIDINRLIKTKLLPMPKAAGRVLTLLRDVNASTHEISDALGLDPIAASRVLRLANSPIYSFQREITALQNAVSAIGNKEIYDIVMLGIAADAFTVELRSPQTDISLWEHSVAVGLAGRELSNVLGMRGADESFTCGLLHDIGKMLLFQSNQKRYEQVINLDNEFDVLKAEKVYYGYSHTQVGCFAAHHWGLPEAICSVILNHHFPQQARQSLVTSHIINVADDLVTEKGFGFSTPTGKMPRSESVIALHLDDEKMEKAWEKAYADLFEIIQVFKK